MPKITINNKTSMDFTPISNIFINNYLPKANGTYVKVYIYTLSNVLNNDENFSTKSIAQNLNILESDVIEALKYWQHQNIITLNNNKDIEELSIEFLPIKDSNSEDDKTIEIKTLKLQKRPEYSPDELAIYSNVPEIKQMFLIAQQYFGKPLSPIDMNILYSFYDWLRLPTDVIELLLEYCISNDHRSMRYIEKVAISWADNNINTVEKAKQQVFVFNKKYRLILKAFGISRREPAPTEIDFMKKWLNVYKMDIDLIVEACNRTMQNISNPSFQYADKIITQWHKSKVKTFEDIKAADTAYAKKRTTKVTNNKPKTFSNSKTGSKFINFKQRDDWDFDEIERLERQYLEKQLSEGR